MSWKLIYVLLLLHAPARLWIWFFFPALFVLVDRLLLANNQSIYLTLRSVKLLPSGSKQPSGLERAQETSLASPSSCPKASPTRPLLSMSHSDRT